MFFKEKTFSLLVAIIKHPGIIKHIIEQQNPPNKDIYDKISSKIAPINVVKSRKGTVTKIFLQVSILSVLNTSKKNEALNEL